MNCHEGLEVSRRDDLESLAYMMIHFVIGELPWMGIKAKSLGEKYKRVYEKKQETVPDEITKILPDEMKSFLKHILELEFEQKPNYDYLSGLIKSLKSKYGYQDDNFEWLEPSIIKELYIKISQNKNEKQNSSAMNNFVMEEDVKEDEPQIGKDIKTHQNFVSSMNLPVKNNLAALNKELKNDNSKHKKNLSKDHNNGENNNQGNNNVKEKQSHKSFRTDLRRRK